jgi:hypothetical protein
MTRGPPACTSSRAGKVKYIRQTVSRHSIRSVVSFRPGACAIRLPKSASAVSAQLLSLDSERNVRARALAALAAAVIAVRWSVTGSFESTLGGSSSADGARSSKSCSRPVAIAPARSVAAVTSSAVAGCSRDRSGGDRSSPLRDIANHAAVKAPAIQTAMKPLCRITPQFSGGAPSCDARRTCIMK